MNVNSNGATWASMLFDFLYYVKLDKLADFIASLFVMTIAE